MLAFLEKMKKKKLVSKRNNKIIGALYSVYAAYCDTLMGMRTYKIMFLGGRP